MFNKTQWILISVLVVQLMFIVWPTLNRASSGTDTLFLKLNSQTVKQIVIEKKDQPVLTFVDLDGQWVLPGDKQKIVNQDKVEALLKRLLSIKSSWPVAQTTTSVERFRVGKKNYLASIKLIDEQQQAVVLLLGLSPGASTTYARIAGTDAVYLIPFNVLDVSVHGKDWLVE